MEGLGCRDGRGTARPALGNPPLEACGSCFVSSLCEASGASSCLKHQQLLWVWGCQCPSLLISPGAAWVALGCGGSGVGASYPSLQKVMPLAPKFSCWRYQGSCKEGSCRAPQEQGGSGEPGQSPRLVGSAAGGAWGSCQGLRAHLPGLVHGIYSLSGLRLKPWVPFPKKNAVKRVFFSYFSFTGCWRFGDGGAGEMLGVGIENIWLGICAKAP